MRFQAVLRSLFYAVCASLLAGSAGADLTPYPLVHVAGGWVIEAFRHQIPGAEELETFVVPGDGASLGTFVNVPPSIRGSSFHCPGRGAHAISGARPTQPAGGAA